MHFHYLNRSISAVVAELPSATAATAAESTTTEYQTSRLTVENTTSVTTVKQQVGLFMQGNVMEASSFHYSVEKTSCTQTYASNDIMTRHIHKPTPQNNTQNTCTLSQAHARASLFCRTHCVTACTMVSTT